MRMDEPLVTPPAPARPRLWLAHISVMTYVSVAFMEATLPDPVSTLVFAADAEGSNETDHGGYGVVAT